MFSLGKLSQRPPPTLYNHILSFAFSHLYFFIRILSSAFFYLPFAAIQSLLYRDLRRIRHETATL